MKLKDQTAIITGATRGMGEAIARSFATEGARLILSGRNVERGKAVQDKIEKQGGKAYLYKATLLPMKPIRN